MELLNNIFWHEGSVSGRHRELILGQKGVVLWFTGLSGSGKSTISNSVAQQLNVIVNLTH